MHGIVEDVVIRIPESIYLYGVNLTKSVQHDHKAVLWEHYLCRFGMCYVTDTTWVVRIQVASGRAMVRLGLEREGHSSFGNPGTRH